MGKACALMLGIIFVGHGLLGLAIGGGHILSVFNADPLIDVIFVVVGAVLLIASLRRMPGAVVRTALIVVAAVLVVLGLTAARDDTIAGLAPAGATLLDVFVYLAGALLCLLAACAPRIGDPIDA